MTGHLVFADAVVIAGGFTDSLGQALTSPWMLAVPAALMLAVSLWLKRRSRRLPLQPLPPAPESEVGDDTVRMLARWLDDDVIAQLERQLAEGDGRG